MPISSAVARLPVIPCAAVHYRLRFGLSCLVRLAFPFFPAGPVVCSARFRSSIGIQHLSSPTLPRSAYCVPLPHDPTSSPSSSPHLPTPHPSPRISRHHRDQRRRFQILYHQSRTVIAPVLLSPPTPILYALITSPGSLTVKTDFRSRYDLCSCTTDSLSDLIITPFRAQWLSISTSDTCSPGSAYLDTFCFDNHQRRLFGASLVPRLRRSLSRNLEAFSLEARGNSKQASSLRTEAVQTHPKSGHFQQRRSPQQARRKLVCFAHSISSSGTQFAAHSACYTFDSRG